MLPVLANTLLNGLGTLAANPQVTAVVTDSRAAAAGSLFVCIAGERVDGHAFAAAALRQGAVGIVAQHAVESVPADKTVLVPNVLDAMITMAGNYRAQFSPVLVGITGSVGKTTTKEFCYAVLSAFGPALKTEGNQNNEIGMPNTLFRLEKDTQYAVVEMGMQGLGEIHKLTMAARPCAAVISNIGRSHLLQLGSRENICKAKLEICDGLPAGAPLILNGDDDFLPHAKLRADLQPTFFAIDNPAADVRAENIETHGNDTTFTLVDKEYGTLRASIPAMGAHNVRNALSAYALATRLGMDAKEAVRALGRYQTTGHRQHVVVHSGVTVIEDCYNANPDSMAAALSTLGSYPCKGRRIAVLGDMFELGEITQSAHTQVGTQAKEAGVDLLLTVGEAARFTHAAAQRCGVQAVHCADNAAAVAQLVQATQQGDTVLVKASNGMHFAEILSGFYAAKQ